MTEHDRFRDDLPLHLTGDLDAAASARLEEHLALCDACRLEFGELKRMHDDLRAAGRVRDDGIDLDGFFDARLAPHLRRRTFSPWLLRAAAAVLLFAGGLAAGRWAWPAAEPPPPEPSSKAQLREAYARSARSSDSQAAMWTALSALTRKP